MMPGRDSGRRFPILFGLGVLLLLGCNSRTQEQAKDELPAWLTEESRQISAAAELEEMPTAELRLNLEPGMQFPLRKVVQQELIQAQVTGTPVRNHSELELMMAISVLGKEQGRTRLGVKYSRVKYRHEVGDEQVDFDSTQENSNLPVGLLPYRDMVNDGFSFWIGEDNQIAEVEGLTEFIDRCLRNVPPDQRKEVAIGIEASSGEAGIANFVDNAIGLLPYGKKTAPGDTWERQHHISRPVPMHVNNIYTLKELTDHLAVVDVRGTITPSTTLSTIESGTGVSVTVNGGSTIGSCTIYRETGLPKESKVDRIVEMTVVMDNSISFRQSKRITTLVESFPISSTTVVRRPGEESIP
jgi:hypothetical protein